MSTSRTGLYTHTFSGRRFYATQAIPSDIYIEDIAHALSLTNRYCGHTPKGPYSVALHSIYVSLECDPHDALWGLLHDGSEAFLCDLPSPVKKQIPQYQVIEDNLMHVICDRFGLSPSMPASVKLADSTVLSAEVRDLFDLPISAWNLPHPAVKRRIKHLDWESVERLFLKRFKELTAPKFFSIPTRFFV